MNVRVDEAGHEHTVSEIDGVAPGAVGKNRFDDPAADHHPRGTDPVGGHDPTAGEDEFDSVQ